MNEYYTPKIEEFHVGFEYEITDGYEFVKKTFSQEDFNTFLYQHLDNAINNEHVRVKYLDEKDIKSYEFNNNVFKNEFIKIINESDNEICLI